DLIKRVHGHFDIGQVHAALVRFHANLDVVVDHPLDGYQDLHGVSLIPIGTVIAATEGAIGSVLVLCGAKSMAVGRGLSTRPRAPTVPYCCIATIVVNR